MRVCDPQWVVRIAAHALWRRRRAIYYALSAASLAGNFIILAGSLEIWGALAGCGLLFYDLWPHLLELWELLTHRSVLYLLLNIILVRIVVKSGVLGAPMPKPVDSPDTYQISLKMQWPATFLHVPTDATLNVEFRDMETLPTAVATSVRQSPAGHVLGAPMLKPDGISPDTYQISSKMQWPATFLHVPTDAALNVEFRDMETLPTAVRQSPAASNSTEVSEGAALFGASLDLVLHDLKHDKNLQEQSIQKAVAASIKEPMAVQLGAQTTTVQQRHPRRASLFTIEPLEMVADDQPHGATQLVGGGQVELPDQVDTLPAKTVQAPLRKVGTRAAILHHQLDSMEESTCGRPSHDDEDESLQLVIKYDRDAAAHLQVHDDDELSPQELKQRADTFITKFKRNLTMQRQASLNRLLALVGGGEIRLVR